jgi:hypothetical protein
MMNKEEMMSESHKLMFPEVRKTWNMWVGCPHA